MKAMKLWMAEDLDDSSQSGFGYTKKAAESYVAGNRGFDHYNRTGIQECKDNAWMHEAVEIEVPYPVGVILLNNCLI